MKNIWKIYSNDLRKTSTNWVALIIIGGLVLLPSLYAWFNIKASWDPYGQLDQLPVGIVNEDQGAAVRDQEIHVGDELVATLKENNSMDWHFADRESAIDSVEHGDYFAVIIIPENFSKNLATVTSDQPEKATVEYYVNEKINAISPKMTDKGADIIVENVSSQFISTVNGVIFDLFNTIGIELENDLPDIERFENYLFEIEEKLPEIYQVLNDSLVDAESATNLIEKANALIPKVEEITGTGLQTIDDTTMFLTEAENRLNELAPQIQQDLGKLQEVTENANQFLQELQTPVFDLSKGETLAGEINTQMKEAIQRIDSVESILIKMQEQSEANPEDEQKNKETIEQITQALEQLNTLKTGLVEIQQNSSEITTYLENTSQDINTVLSELKEKAATTADAVDTFVKEYKETIEPTVLESVSSAKSTLTEARSILVDIQGAIPEVENILARTDTTLDEGTELIQDVLAEYPYVNERVNDLADRIRQIQGETDISEIIKLLQNDPEAEKGFFAEPVQLDTHTLFPVANYGAGMTPFYTVLSIWVGGLLLISLLSTEVHSLENYTLRQEYFGKLLTFFTIGILQTLIITVGDIFLINVEVAHAGWFILFGLFISFVFMLITYTLVSVFGDVGKAMVIVLLVLQIAGSGGTYPVMLLPEFFQTIHPYLPFSYAVDLMREAVGGIVWDRALKDMIYLFLFGLAAFLLGAFLKQPINKQTRKLVNKSRESGMFH